MTGACTSCQPAELGGARPAEVTRLAVKLKAGHLSPTQIGQGIHIPAEAATLEESAIFIAQG